VSDPAVRGIITARRIVELVKELSLKVGKSALIVSFFPFCRHFCLAFYIHVLPNSPDESPLS